MLLFNREALSQRTQQITLLVGTVSVCPPSCNKHATIAQCGVLLKAEDGSGVSLSIVIGV